MKIEDVEKELKNGNLSSLYLLYGEEKFLLGSVLKKIYNLFGEMLKGINYITIDENNLNELIPNIETPSFGFEKKIIVAKNLGIFKKASKRKNPKEEESFSVELKKYLEENLSSIKGSVIIIFVEEEIEKNSLVDFIEENGIVCNFEFQKPAQIQARIKLIANSYRVNIDNFTLAYFIESCGTNMQELINEIRKLIEYAGENGVIKKEDIDNLCIKKIDSVIFDLTDNLGKKNTKQAIEILRNLVKNKEPMQKILITLYNHFKRLFLLKIALKENKDIVYSLDLKPNQTFLVNKYKKQAEFFKIEELKTILKEFIELDYKSKIGLIDLEIGFEAILCAYC